MLNGFHTCTSQLALPSVLTPSVILVCRTEHIYQTEILSILNGGPGGVGLEIAVQMDPTDRTNLSLLVRWSTQI